MSLLNITSLEKALEHYTSPDEILARTRKTIIERLKNDGSEEGGKDGMDCSLLCFDFENMKLQIAAAHNPVWIIRTSTGSATEGNVTPSVVEVKADKMPVGKHDKENEAYTLHSFDLQKGDKIYALTDGFPDQFGGPKQKKFMSKNLKELILAYAHLPMQEQYLIYEKSFNDWKGNLEQTDDMTLIGIEV